MSKVKLTPANLAELKKKAAGCDPKYWIMDQHGDVVAVDFDNKNTNLKIASVDFFDDAEHIAAADPATVLAMLDELTDVRMALLELAWEFYGRDQTREEIESCCAVMVENERASRKESEAGQ